MIATVKSGSKSIFKHLEHVNSKKCIVVNSSTINYFIVELCPKGFPYAYMGGDYCCTTEKEGSFKELDDYSKVDRSSCDGGPISLNSVCCQNNRFVRCPNNKKCKSGKGRMKILAKCY